MEIDQIDEWLNLVLSGQDVEKVDEPISFCVYRIV
jgi:hypothetical protein